MKCTSLERTFFPLGEFTELKLQELRLEHFFKKCVVSLLPIFFFQNFVPNYIPYNTVLASLHLALDS